MASARFKVVVQKPARGGDGFALERQVLESVGAEILEVPAETDAQFREAAADADALIAQGRRIGAEIISGLERCLVIACPSIGSDRVDVEAATRAGIVVTNVPDVFVEEVADHTVLLFLAVQRRLRVCDRLIRTGEFAAGHPALWETPRIYGQTAGLLSFGSIARAVARRLLPFGLRVLAHDPYVSELELTTAGVEPVSLAELLARSDVVSNHLPLNAETHHLIGAAEFRAMKRGAIFVNTGRGPTVDQAALIEALRSGQLGGAGLDVFDPEPLDPGSPLLELENVICTPHVASSSARMIRETRRRAADEIALVLRGYWPRSAVNPAVLPRTHLERWQPIPMSRGPNR